MLHIKAAQCSLYHLKVWHRCIHLHQQQQDLPSSWSSPTSTPQCSAWSSTPSLSPLWPEGWYVRMRTPREFQGGFVVFKVRLKDGSTISCSATLKGKVYVLHFHFVSGTLDLIRQGLVCFKSRERSLHLGSFSFSSSLPFSSSSSPTFKVLADLKSNMALWQKCKSIGNSFF